MAPSIIFASMGSWARSIRSFNSSEGFEDVEGGCEVLPDFIGDRSFRVFLLTLEYTSTRRGRIY